MELEYDSLYIGGEPIGVPGLQVHRPVKSQPPSPGPIASGPAGMWAHTEGEF